MFDIGVGELLALAVVGLLIFGPEKLPKAAADAGRWIRQIREMATNARKELSDSAGVDFSGAMDSVREFRDLHPKRLAAGVFDDDPDDASVRISQPETATRHPMPESSSSLGSPSIRT